MRKYYISHVHSYERATTMEKQLMHFCKEKAGFVITHTRLLSWVDEIRQRQREIKQAAPRIKEVEISLSKACFGEGYSSIRIGEGYITLESVKGEEM